MVFFLLVESHEAKYTIAMSLYPTKSFGQLRYGLFLILGLAALVSGNLVLFWISSLLNLPLVLDSLFTMSAALVLGPGFGMIVGLTTIVLINLAFYNSLSYSIFLLSAMVVSLGFGFSLRSKDDQTIIKILLALGFFSAVVAIFEAVGIHWLFQGQFVGAGSSIIRSLYINGMDVFPAAVLTRFVLRAMEYTLALILSHGMFNSLRTESVKK